MNRIKLSLVALLAVLLLVAPLGCAPGTAPQTVASHAFDSTVLALEVVDKLEADRIQFIEDPSPEDVEAVRKRVDRLRAIRDALAKVRAAEVGEDTYADLGLAVSLLRDAVMSLRAEGHRVPPETENVLAFVQSWLEVQGLRGDP